MHAARTALPSLPHASPSVHVLTGCELSIVLLLRHLRSAAALEHMAHFSRLSAHCPDAAPQLSTRDHHKQHLRAHRNQRQTSPMKQLTMLSLVLLLAFPDVGRSKTVSEPAASLQRSTGNLDSPTSVMRGNVSAASRRSKVTVGHHIARALDHATARPQSLWSILHDICLWPPPAQLDAYLCLSFANTMHTD